MKAWRKIRSVHKCGTRRGRQPLASLVDSVPVIPLRHIYCSNIGNRIVPASIMHEPLPPFHVLQNIPLINLLGLSQELQNALLDGFRLFPVIYEMGTLAHSQQSKEITP